MLLNTVVITYFTIASNHGTEKNIRKNRGLTIVTSLQLNKKIGYHFCQQIGFFFESSYNEVQIWRNKQNFNVCVFMRFLNEMRPFMKKSNTCLGLLLLNFGQNSSKRKLAIFFTPIVSAVPELNKKTKFYLRRFHRVL